MTANPPDPSQSRPAATITVIHVVQWRRGSAS
jgi:hypothetical protein